MSIRMVSYRYWRCRLWSGTYMAVHTYL